MGGTSSAYGRDESYIHGFGGEKWRTEHLEDSNVNGV
jgi:hypothetical protein